VTNNRSPGPLDPYVVESQRPTQGGGSEGGIPERDHIRRAEYAGTRDTGVRGVAKTPSSRRSAATPHHENVTSAPQRLLAAEPFLDLVDTLKTEVQVLATSAPMSDAAPTMKRIMTQLQRTIEQARETALWLSIEDLERLTNKPQSTLRRLCQTHGLAIGARKVAGSWSIFFPDFQKFMTSQARSGAEIAA
jgi:hypothetical protein